MLQFQQKLTNRFYAVLSLPATAMGFALSVQIAALSWILSTKYHLEIHDIGLVWAAGPIAGILGQVIIGAVSDNVWFWGGRRRPFILIGGVLAALGMLALPFLDVISAALGIEAILGVAIAVALTLDMAINISFNPTRSIIADVTPEGVERTKGYTWMQTISGTFGVMAYMIGALWDNYVLIYVGAGLVFVLSVFPALFVEEPKELCSCDMTVKPGSQIDWLAAFITIKPLWGFLIYAIYAMTLRLAHIEYDHYWVELACLLITLFFVVRTVLKRENPGQAGLDHLGFQKVLAAHSFTWVGVQSMFVYMFSFIQDKLPHLSDIDMGRMVSISFLILSAVSAVLPVLVLEPLSRRFGRVRTHAACIGSMAFGYFLLSQNGGSPIAVYALMALLGVGWAATISLPFAIMSQKVEQQRMGLYMGLFNLSVVLPQLVASLGVGQIVSRAEDKSLVFIICAGCLMVSAVCWLLVRDEQSNS